MSFHKSFGGGTDTSDATAEQWDIKTGKDAYIASGKVTGTGYFPALMQFDGSTGYYSRTYTSSGNKFTAVGIFKYAGASLGIGARIINAIGPSGSFRPILVIGDADNADANIRNKLQLLVQNNTPTNACRLISTMTVADNLPHSFFIDFDGDAGTARLQIDGSDADDTSNGSRIAPAVTALASGASSPIAVGADHTTANNKRVISIGYLGLSNTAGLTPTNFFHPDGSPKNIESTLSTVWGGPPLFWNPSGDMVNNLGSAGAMTKNGTINVADPSTWS